MSPSRAYAREPEATGAGRGSTGGFAGMPSEVSERTRTIPIASARMTPRAPARICRFRSLRSRRPSSRSKSPRSRSTVRLSRSRTSAILGIVDLHHLSERVAPVARQGTDRRVRDVVARRREPDGSSDREHGAPIALAEQVHRAPVQVANRVVHPADAVPPLPHLEERVLHELLRLGTVPGDEPQPPEQAASLRVVEGLEGAGRLELVEGRVRDDDPFGHVRWMNPRDATSVQVDLALLDLSPSGGRREEPGGSTRLAVLTPPDPSRKRSPTRTDLRRLGT